MSGWDALWINGNLATMEAGGTAYGAIKDGAVAVANGRIAWLGAASALTAPAHSLADQVYDLQGGWVTPGLIDCHTHLVFGGNRAGEFEQRLEGVSYEAIAKAGGGINATVTSTRAMDEAALFEVSRRRLEAFLAEGVTTMEIKSGYGLDLATEMKMLRVARRLGESDRVDIRTTFLGAHALPPEFKTDREGYLKLIIEQMLPAVAAEGLADAVDAFCENIGFSAAEVRRIFEKARTLDLPVKLHADQLSDGDGAALAAEFNALSADHLEHTNAAGVKAMARSGTVAVLLPGAFYILRETKLPPMASFQEHGVPIALASDCNPGSSPVLSLLAMINMGCTLFRLTPEQSLSGVTRHAAKALGLENEIGSLRVGKQADMVVWDIETPAQLAYWLGGNPVRSVIKNGRVVG